MCSLLFSTKKLDNIEYVNWYLKKRGLDATVVKEINNHTFIHNLLSLTGEFTPQPIIDNNCVVLFNGEIYNYKSFGEYDCDSKCILPLYNKYGSQFVEKLDGEYAIVIVDYNKNVCFAYTDPFATKPLWLAIDNGNFSLSTYDSGLKRQGFASSIKLEANKTFTIPFNNPSSYTQQTVYEWSLNQFKDSFDDWIKSFENAVSKRTKTKDKIFLGLSSGYDSGCIAFELKKQNIDFKTYTLRGTENENVLQHRLALLNGNHYVVDKNSVLDEGKKYINENVEEFLYKTWTLRSNYNEFNLRLHNDNGSGGFSAVCKLACADKRRVCFSGMGADEVVSDYGFNGVSKYAHSNFGGLFPKDLKTIFPWPSFYGSTMYSYLGKEEYIGGSYNIENRYVFLDKKLVQEFLWLDVKLKNSAYKAPLDYYMKINGVPYAPGQKIGF